MVEYLICKAGLGLTCDHKVNTPQGTGCGLGVKAYDSYGNLCPYIQRLDIEEKPLNIPEVIERG